MASVLTTAPVAAPPVRRLGMPTGLLGKLVRCAAVSGVTTGLSLSVLGVGAGPLGLSPAAANVLATIVATVPAYHLNRRWVWRQAGPSDLRRQVLPFWLLSFAGLLVSTLAVAMAGHWAASAELDGATRTLVLQGACLGAWGGLWVVQFVVKDRWLFREG